MGEFGPMPNPLDLIPRIALAFDAVEREALNSVAPTGFVAVLAELARLQEEINAVTVKNIDLRAALYGWSDKPKQIGAIKACRNLQRENNRLQEENRRLREALHSIVEAVGDADATDRPDYKPAMFCLGAAAENALAPTKASPTEEGETR